MCLILLTCSLFLPISMFVHPLTLPFIGLTLGLLFTTVFSAYAVFCPKVMYICRFLAKSHLYTWVFGKNPRIHVGFWPKVMYIRGFLAKNPRIHAGFWPEVTYTRRCCLNSHVHPSFWWVWCCGKLLGGLWVWLVLPWVWCCLLDASFVTRD